MKKEVAMQVLGIRYCAVSPEATEQVAFLAKLGLPKTDYNEGGVEGAVFPAGTSWVELWKASADMPASTMLQVVVDDADAFAAHARANGLSPQGPTDAHGERIYFLQAPGGLAVSFQSKLQGA
jgi:hypothetical protein